jgi:hypothetical protein
VQRSQKIYFSLTILATVASLATGGYYIADTLAGKNTTLGDHLKVIGFCPVPAKAAPTAQAGAAGEAGSEGQAGADGEAGTPGAAGSSGSNGVDGSTGATGEPGSAGEVGATGAPGTDGAAGLSGASGSNGSKGDTGATGATGPAGATGATGATGVCTGMVSLTSITGDMIPAVDNLYSLGTSSFRWKGLQLGPGTLYIQDTVTGSQAGLTVTDGSLLIDGADSLRIGNVRLTATGLRSVLSDQDITIGALGDTGYLSVATGIKFRDGTVVTSATGFVGATGATGATGPAGATGAPGPIGATGPQGIPGMSGGLLEVSAPAPEELDLKNSVFALSNGTYRLPEGKDGQLVHFVITDDADITRINVIVSTLRYTHGSSVRTEKDENWIPFDTNISPNTMVSALYTQGAWNINGGKTH